MASQASSNSNAGPSDPAAHSAHGGSVAPVFRLYDTLTHAVVLVRPADPARITFYSCGPTVYDDAHIGNFRSFLAADVLRRWLESPMCVVEGADGQPHAGPRSVRHVMNITDVGHMTDDVGGDGEDRMEVAGRRIAEAKKAGKLPADVTIDPRDPYAIAAFYAERFKEDARRLGLKVAIEAEKDAKLMPRASENIVGMRRVIERLVELGHAYVAGPAGARAVYFDVRTFPEYGRLSGNTMDALKEGAGERVSAGNQEQKRSPADFLLWKEDESHLMKWDSPGGGVKAADGSALGKGYPGWHIECTVMAARSLLGDAEFESLVVEGVDRASIIDFHSGGEDNIFPHHECEIAQSMCAFCTGAVLGTDRLGSRSPSGDRLPGGAGGFARHWFHARFLFVEGEKMSKSKGNFFTARDLFAGGAGGGGAGGRPPFEPAAVRLELIRTHYRSNANFTIQGMTDAARMVERWRRVVEGAERGSGGGAVNAGQTMPAASEEGNKRRAEARRAFAEAMSDDLNVAGAIGVVNSFVSACGGGAGAASADVAANAALMREFDAVLGVLELEKPKASSTSIGVFIGCEPDRAVLAKLEERVEARKAKNFARSDAIRDELAAMGYQIKDVGGAGGKVEVRRG